MRVLTLQRAVDCIYGSNTRSSQFDPDLSSHNSRPSRTKDPSAHNTQRRDIPRRGGRVLPQDGSGRRSRRARRRRRRSRPGGRHRGPRRPVHRHRGGGIHRRPRHAPHRRRHCAKHVQHVDRRLVGHDLSTAEDLQSSCARILTECDGFKLFSTAKVRFHGSQLETHLGSGGSERWRCWLHGLGWGRWGTPARRASLPAQVPHPPWRSWAAPRGHRPLQAVGPADSLSFAAPAHKHKHVIT